MKIDYVNNRKKILDTFNGWRKLKTSVDRAQNQHERLFLLHIENPFILPVNVVISTYIHNVRTFLQPESERELGGGKSQNRSNRNMPIVPHSDSKLGEKAYKTLIIKRN